MEMTLLRGKYCKGRSIWTPSKGIGLPGGKSNSLVLGCPANQYTPELTITSWLFSKINLS